MKLIKCIAAAILLLPALPLTAHAQDSGTYGSIGAATYEFETYGLDAKLGYSFSKNFGAEVQGILGLTSDSTQLSSSPSSATLTQKVDYTLGVFAIARLPLSEQFELFARGGIHQTKYGFEINNALNSTVDSNLTGFAGGGGAQYNLDKRNALRLEHTFLDRTDIHTTSVSYVRKF